MRKEITKSRSMELASTLYKRPWAEAWVKGSPKYPTIEGRVLFYQTLYGVLVEAEIFGLPEEGDKCPKSIFAFHIHEGGSCDPGSKNDFPETGGHYNPNDCEHPYHAGDMPPLFGNAGYAFMTFLTNRFSVKEVIGKTVIIHAGKDDFTTQPSGNAGEKMACGEIKSHLRKY